MREADRNVAIVSSVIYGSLMVCGFVGFLLVQHDEPLYKLRSTRVATCFVCAFAFLPTLLLVGALVPWLCAVYGSWSAAMTFAIVPGGILFFVFVAFLASVDNYFEKRVEYRSSRPSPWWDQDALDPPYGQPPPQAPHRRTINTTTTNAAANYIPPRASSNHNNNHNNVNFILSDLIQRTPDPLPFPSSAPRRALRRSVSVTEDSLVIRDDHDGAAHPEGLQQQPAAAPLRQPRRRRRAAYQDGGADSGMVRSRSSSAYSYSSAEGGGGVVFLDLPQWPSSTPRDTRLV